MSPIYCIITFDKEFKPKPSSKVVDKDGKPLVVYHQTAADINAFNTENEFHGKYDSETPTGLFFKTTDKDIGLIRIFKAIICIIVIPAINPIDAGDANIIQCYCIF